MRVLLTGANGFIAHHIANHLIHKCELWLQYRSNDSRIADLKCNQIKFDLNEGFPKLPKFDYIIHTAANTWVDGSLKDSLPYVMDNVFGTANLLEWVKTEQPQAKVCIFSSDEVLGPAKEGEFFKEDQILKPSNPYSATKGSQELLAYSFANSFDLNIFIVRCMNVYGKGESDQKFIGKVLNAIKEGKKVTLHGTSPSNCASRHWVHAKDVASAVWFLMEKAKSQEIYHIAGEEMDVYTMAKILGATEFEWVDFHKARPGHDRRYSLSNKKLLSMGWKPQIDLKQGLLEVIE